MEAKAPEKIYIQPNAHDGWFENNNVNKSLTEYTRTDAFIKKAEKWIKDNGYMYNGECEGDVKAMAEHFVNCMKGE